MPNLNSRKETYVLGSDTSVINSTNPSGAVGVDSLSAQTGFFVYSSFAYELWFKDQNGIWGMYKAISTSGGNTFAWGTNQAFYLKTSEVSGDIKVFKREGAILVDNTPGDDNDEPDALVIEDATSLSLLDKSGQEISTVSVGSSNHTELTNLGWTASGHSGAAYSVVMFDANGAAVEVAAPAEGSRADKVLKWTSDTEIGWVAQ
jgi:hypothetical protein